MDMSAEGLLIITPNSRGSSKLTWACRKIRQNRRKVLYQVSATPGLSEVVTWLRPLLCTWCYLRLDAVKYDHGLVQSDTSRLCGVPIKVNLLPGA